MAGQDKREKNTEDGKKTVRQHGRERGVQKYKLQQCVLSSPKSRQSI